MKNLFQPENIEIMIKDKDFTHGLLDFIQQSPTPFHTVQSMVILLEDAGFQRLTEKEQWFVEQGEVAGRYFVDA